MLEGLEVGAGLKNSDFPPLRIFCCRWITQAKLPRSPDDDVSESSSTQAVLTLTSSAPSQLLTNELVHTVQAFLPYFFIFDQSPNPVPRGSFNTLPCTLSLAVPTIFATPSSPSEVAHAKPFHKHFANAQGSAQLSLQSDSDAKLLLI